MSSIPSTVLTHDHRPRVGPQLELARVPEQFGVGWVHGRVDVRVRVEGLHLGYAKCHGLSGSPLKRPVAFQMEEIEVRTVTT